MDLFSNATNAIVSDFPVMGTVLMIAIFVYAWIADTVERREAFEDYNPEAKQGPPVVIESFYVEQKGLPPMIDRPYALDS